MSLSRSNISNDSSRSNILTLSQDSETDEIKLNTVNLYYKKFIGKLGFLFHLDTSDLDALYSKISQCVNESEGFLKSDDTDINELIELANKLKDNHNLLKAMVKLLDQRFLQKNPTTRKYHSVGEPKEIEEQMTPKSKAEPIPIDYEVTPIVKRTSNNNSFIHENLNEFSSSLNGIHKVGGRQYSESFTENLNRAREEVKRKKELKLGHLSKEKNNKSIDSENGKFNRKASKSKDKSEYKERLERVKLELSKIKDEARKIESFSLGISRNGVLDPDVSLSLENPNLENTRAMNSEKLNEKVHEEDPVVFQQISEDSYYLFDNRYENAQFELPKLNFNEYRDEENNLMETNMTMIKETSRESGSMAEIQSEKESYDSELENRRNKINTNVNYVNGIEKENMIQKKHDYSQSEEYAKKAFNLSLSEFRNSDNQKEKYKVLNTDEEEFYKSECDATFIDKLTSNAQNDKNQKTTNNLSFQTTDVTTSVHDKNSELDLNGNKAFSFTKEKGKLINFKAYSPQEITYETETQHFKHNQMDSFVKDTKVHQKQSFSAISNAPYTEGEVMPPKFIPKEKNAAAFAIEKENEILRHANRVSNNGFSYSEVNSLTHDVKIDRTTSKSEKDVYVEKSESFENHGEFQQVPKLVDLVENDEKLSHQNTKEIEYSYHQIPTPGLLEGQTLEVASNDNASENSFSDHLQNKNEAGPHTTNESQSIFQKHSVSSLFEQSRNVESKLEISENRHIPRVPGQEIEKIKNRVNEMFEKIKEIRMDPTGNTSNNGFSEAPIQISSQENSFLFNKTKRQGLPIKITEPLYYQEPPVRSNDSFLIDKTRKNIVRLSFVYESPKKHFETNHHARSETMKDAQIMERQSNFLFQGPPSPHFSQTMGTFRTEKEKSRSSSKEVIISTTNFSNNRSPTILKLEEKPNRHQRMRSISHEIKTKNDSIHTNLASPKMGRELPPLPQKVKFIHNIRQHTTASNFYNQRINEHTNNEHSSEKIRELSKTQSESFFPSPLTHQKKNQIVREPSSKMLNSVVSRYLNAPHFQHPNLVSVSVQPKLNENSTLLNKNYSTVLLDSSHASRESSRSQSSKSRKGLKVISKDYRRPKY